MKSLNDLEGRSGIMFSFLLRRQGKALDRKVVEGLEARIPGNVCTYIRRKPRKVQQKFCENRRRRSRLMDAPPPARAFLGLAASPKVWLREKNASQANATCESRAILPQWHDGEYRLFSSVKYARVTLAMARRRVRGKHNRIFDFRNERWDFVRALYQRFPSFSSRRYEIHRARKELLGVK